MFGMAMVTVLPAPGSLGSKPTETAPPRSVW